MKNLIRRSTISGLSVLLWLCNAAAADSAATDSDPVARGKYLVTVTDCGGCHTGGALAGNPDPKRYLAGSDIGFGGSAPMGAMTGGVVYPTNLTADEETGLGRWTDQEIIRAIRQGKSRDGRDLVPIMPWPSYSVLSDADVKAIVAYLRSVPPVRFQAPRNVKPGEQPTGPYLRLVQPEE